MSDSVRPHREAAHQAPPSLGFSGQEHWSGLPFPSPMHESEVAQWCLTQRPHGLQPTRPSVHGIFQARVLEWAAIAFSNRTLTHGIYWSGISFLPSMSEFLTAIFYLFIYLLLYLVEGNFYLFILFYTVFFQL